MRKKIVIVGGVAGGSSAAARLRRLDEFAEIIIFERGEYISFANCGLPYYIGGIITNKNALIIQTPEIMSKRFNLDIRTNNEIIKIDPKSKYVTVKNLKTNEIYNESYDKLILSPGAQPIKPSLPGIKKSDNLFTLRTIPDADAIISYIIEKKPKNAVVIGGGFIGIEIAENLHARGLHVSIVELTEQILTQIDLEMASILHNHIKSKGIELILGDGVKEFKEQGAKIVLNSNRELSTDLTILAIGVKPEINLAESAGLEIGVTGGIKVNEYLQTSDENIYAIGDAIEVRDYITGHPTLIPLAGPANKQGRIVANNICGKKEKYLGTLGTSVVKVFDMTAAFTGNNEKMLQAKGITYKTIYISPSSHATYYPGATSIHMKLIFDSETGKILGAQAVGYEGVDKRIDVIASVMRLNGTVYDLTELELAYAPPYSSAKDPVNMIGFVAENQLEGLVDVVLCRELEELDRENTVILGVFSEEEFQVGSIEGSINIPLEELRDRLDELDKEKLYITYCAVGLRGYIAARILMQHGFKVKNLAGGFNMYKKFHFKHDEIISNSDDIIEFNDSGIQKIQNKATGEVYKLNACGLSCPGPIIKVSEKLKTLNEGDRLEVISTDPGFMNDIKSWCKNTGNTLISAEKIDDKYVAIIEKGNKSKKESTEEMAPIKDGKNLIIFSGDLDKAIASFIIANGARAMGKEVTMFFTFWGLNIIKKETQVKTKKDFMAKMFSKMMPKNSKKLGLSKMNMAGIGPKLIRKVMKDKNIQSLEELIDEAMKSGVRMVACQMSMDVMGVAAEELLDGVEIGGVATMLAASDESNMSLFI
ncbi:MAG: CoA-disulfide reductase [Bacteroidales bacterium]|jgi:CoA-disulfide reductase|nr:CoA-disulfide reductase [Bacteroidales bacterium]MDI9575372.1 CoA-disulfide reductase [Bacteroidota bacterium]MDY0400079.1 CoA-disulfide reductase [Bacteroidales bacterium]HOB78140.1 CoA-disulfide reductase [Bacteroidales bacterium]HQD59293.1 CoA-disulfide reductase [Bacteroidales bacterium]